MARNEVRWERMFPDELEAAFAACPVAYFPYGLCEPHGPQCTVGLDALKAHGIACATARQHGGIVAPPDYWHIHEVGGYAFWSEKAVGQPKRHWLTSMPPWQHFKNVCYHVRTADVLGFEAAIFLTGHYGPNWEDLVTLIDLLQPHVGTRLFALPDWMANDKGFKGDGEEGGDHAGRVETSLLWAIEPDCVDMSRMPESFESEGTPHFAMGHNAFDSDRRVGERMVADEIAWLAAKADTLRADYASLKPSHTLRTFEQVEQLWADVVRPAVNDFRSMQPAWTDETREAGRVPKDSVWYENQHITEAR